MEKAILAGSNAILSDCKVDIVDWAVNETELSLDNNLYRRFLFCRHWTGVGTEEAFYDYYKDRYKEQALLYVTSYFGNKIIHLDQIRHLTKSIHIKTYYDDSYDVNLEISKDYDGYTRYRLDYKDKYYTTIFTDFNIQSVIAKEYYLCKTFSYHVDPLPNKPIVLRNRNSNRETQILTKRDNETWKDFIYDNASVSFFHRDIHDTLCEYKNKSPAYYNLFLSPNNYRDLLKENALHAYHYGKEFLTWDKERYVYGINVHRTIDVTIRLNEQYKEKNE